MSHKVLYFGYGANRDPKMIAAIVGKPESELVGRPATLEGYSLGVQRLDQIPDITIPKAPAPISARDLLKESWDETFTSYVIKQDREGKVSGTIWELTPDERERIRDWELIDFGWYEDCEGLAKTPEGEEIPIITERLGSGQQIDREVDGIHYETWLNDPARFEIVAEKARQEYDERLKGPEGSTAHPDIKQS